MSKRRLGLLLGASALAMVASDAGAAKNGERINRAEKLAATQFVTHAGYTASRSGRDSGTNEMGAVTHFVDPNGVQRMVEVHMSSDVPDSMGFWQCFATCWVGDEEGGWKPTAQGVQVSFNVGGDRNCNRPQVSAAALVTNQTPDGVIALSYGSDFDDPQNTSYWVSAIDPVSCSIVSLPNNTMDVVQVSADVNNDNGGSDQTVIVESIFSPTDDTDLQEFTVLSATFENNGGGQIWANGARLERDAVTGDLNVSRRFTHRVYTDVNTARQSIAILQDGVVAIGGPVGDNRPPDVGVGLFVLDWMQGNVMAEHIIQETNELTDIWPNDVRLAPGQYPGDIVWKHNISNGFGEDTNDKGTSQLKLHTLRLTEDWELIIQDTLEDIDMPFQTHAALCTGADGAVEATDRSIAVVTGSPSGAGQGQMSIFDFGTEKKLGLARRKATISDYSDSGMQSNIFGANPNNQGRNFFNCVGEVPNPGYGVDGGFRPYVKSFWAITMSGKEPAFERNSQFLSLTPATGDFEDGPGSEDPCLADPNAADCVGPDGPEAGVDPNAQAGACACTTPKSAPAAPGLIVLGLGLALAAARRRREDV